MSIKVKKKAPLIFAIGGAKGGVGKSLVCSNLSIQFAQEGMKVAVLDLDFGAANLHTIFGLSKPKQGWAEYFEDPSQNLKTFLTPTKQKDLYLLPASGFVAEMADLEYSEKVDLISKIKDLPVDIVFLDLGAGSSKDMVDFFTIADYKILVSTSEPTALMNNFEFVKNVLYRSLKRIYRHQPKLLPLLNEFKKHSGATIQKLIDSLAENDEWQSEHVQALCNELSIYIVFNQIRKIEEAETALRLKKVCQKQLNIELQYPGFVFYNEAVAACVQKMLPISLVLPQSITSRIFRRIAHHLIEDSKLAKKDSQLLSIAWSHLDQDFKKNKAEAKKRLLLRD
ncbi:MAG: Iron-sulfur cluster carrier protein [Chlamydiae bacterium]|nr:Iron-sulfur cluster carrier protein [Chlamydiota bacterium]